MAFLDLFWTKNEVSTDLGFSQSRNCIHNDVFKQLITGTARQIKVTC